MAHPYLWGVVLLPAARGVLEVSSLFGRVPKQALEETVEKLSLFLCA